jgi:hypothetical protein
MHDSDKPEGTHIDHAEIHDQSLARDANSLNLKITRDSYWENKKGIALCLLLNMAAFEYGLDQGMFDNLS